MLRSTPSRLMRCASFTYSFTTSRTSGRAVRAPDMPTQRVGVLPRAVGLVNVGQRRSAVQVVSPRRDCSHRFRHVLFPNPFPTHQATSADTDWRYLQSEGGRYHARMPPIEPRIPVNCAGLAGRRQPTRWDCRSPAPHLHARQAGAGSRPAAAPRVKRVGRKLSRRPPRYVRGSLGKTVRVGRVGLAASKLVFALALNAPGGYSTGNSRLRNDDQRPVDGRLVPLVPWAERDQNPR